VTYTEALAYIASLAPRGWRLGLDRMREFAIRAGLEDVLASSADNRNFNYIHVAGTNGKGSTNAYIQSILHESGYRTGSFFSPFVYDPRERIQLGREYIPEKVFAGLTALLQPLAEEFTETEYGGISEFEFKTAMAFMFYKRLKCEWIALEVGLGGRLDSTNIVVPRCGVIVSIGLDHTNILGETIDEIAFEKAGIVKPGVPLVVGQMPAPAFDIVQEQAASKGCEVWRYGREITVAQDATDRSIVVTTPRGQHAGLRLGIKGAMQGHNMALAVAACDAAGATRTLGGLQRGTAKASIPGRFEIRIVRERTVILDGAHNAEAAAVLAESLRSYLATGTLPGSDISEQIDSATSPGGEVLLVTGMVAGHDPAKFYRPFAEIANAAYLVPIDFHRALPVAELEPVVEAFLPVLKFDSVADGLEAALSAAKPRDVVVITGSFYLVGEAGKVLTSIT
jgi:dihydrofolate synthase / folylpolyglutamate synthase